MTNHEQAPIAPPLDQVTAAYQDVLTHNAAHTHVGVSFRSAYAALIKHSDIIEGGEGVLPAEESAEEIYSDIDRNVAQAGKEGDMDADLQELFHSDTFLRIGIKIAPLGMQVRGGEKEAASTSTELVPTVENTELFTDFLAGLNPEDMQEEENLRLTSDVVSQLRQLITVAYGKVDPSVSAAEHELVERFGEDALRTFLALDFEYKRLGIDHPASYQARVEATPTSIAERVQRRQAQRYLEDYNTLEGYLTYWGRGVLEEHISIGPKQLLEATQENYFDGNHDELTAKVQEVIGLVGPARTHDFGVESAVSLLRGIEVTIQRMNDDPDAWFASDSNRQLLEESALRLRSVVGA